MVFNLFKIYTRWEGVKVLPPNEDVYNKKKNQLFFINLTAFLAEVPVLKVFLQQR